jgi:tight adherence protein B
MDVATKWLLGGVIASLGVVVLGDPGSGLFLLLVVALFGIGLRLGPGFLEKQKTKKKYKKIQEIFPQSLGMMIQALKSGQTMQQVLEYLSQECPEPLKGEYLQVCRDMALGAAADKALAFMSDRYPEFDDFRQFIESYRISKITGANLTRLLEVLLENLQEKDRLTRKRDAMTAQARLSGMLMGCLPFLLGLVFFVMDPNLMLPLFTRPQGWAILFIAFLLETIGFLWIRQLLALEF